jgi:hypothetical protein
MVTRAVKLTSYDSYIEHAFPAGSPAAARSLEAQERQALLVEFPHSVVLEVAFPEMDFADRWCWQHFGPARGECQQHQSDYPVCSVVEPHAHEGAWCRRWLEKTDYEFGYCAWYFVSAIDRDRFLAFVSELSWGERYP